MYLDEFKEVAYKMYEEDLKRHREYLEKYPPNPPNDMCNHAIISGFLIENSLEPFIDDYNLFFETRYEKIYIWTNRKDKYSCIISEVHTEVSNLPFWKNVGEILRLTDALWRAFEYPLEPNDVDYKWIYYFDPTTSTDDSVIYNTTNIDKLNMFNGIVIKATHFSNMADVIQLLLNDDRFYVALSLLCSSFETHYCCLICELNESGYKKHPSHEPETWEQAKILPCMEMAIVQACRCVESLIGEPPNRTNKTGLYRHKNKWIELFNINADDDFNKAGCSYLDFYYSLFHELRNPAAHSYGNINFNLERKRTIEAQCFAAILVRHYYENICIDNDAAIESLKFNTDLLNKVSKNISTTETKEKE